MGAKGTSEPPLTLRPSSLPTGLFNMVFAVLPPWGPWSDNVVPLVRLSQCLIRTANGASLTPCARPPPPAATPQPAAPEANKELHSRLLASLDPKNLGHVCRSLGGGLWTGPRAWHLARGPVHVLPSSWTTGQPAGNTFRQARVPCSPVAGSTDWRNSHGTQICYALISPCPLSPQWLFILQDMNSSGQVATRLL